MVSRIRIAIIICIGTLLTTWVLAQPGDGDNGNIVVPESAFLRGGPAESYPGVGYVFAGDNLTPLNLSPNGQWVLVPYTNGYGWIQRNLVNWTNEATLNRLPVLQPDVTPTLNRPPVATVVLPTNTPTGSYINIFDARSAYVRSGPGQNYLRLGQLLPGQQVDPVARNQDTSWVMIRYRDEFMDGFAWIAESLVFWQENAPLSTLPVITEDDLTPAPTFRAEITPLLRTTTPSSTRTPPATRTRSITATATTTERPTETATDAPTSTISATDEDTATATATETATDSPTETATNAVAGVAAVDTTVTEESSPTDEPTASRTPLIAPTSAAVVATAEPSATMQSVVLPNSDDDAVRTSSGDNSFGLSVSLPLEAIIGGAAALLLLGYVGLYARGVGSVNRYGEGFVSETCPVCQRGTLHMDEKAERVLGIPHMRRIVRCDECRSVLRQVRPGRWRYAVDRLENPALYEKYNNSTISDDELRDLAENPPRAMNRRRSRFEAFDDEE